LLNESSRFIKDYDFRFRYVDHSLQKCSRESNLDCNPFCKLDRRITSSAYKRQSILLLLMLKNIIGEEFKKIIAPI
jgi:hypothetical protein